MKDSSVCGAPALIPADHSNSLAIWAAEEDVMDDTCDEPVPAVPAESLKGDAAQPGLHSPGRETWADQDSCHVSRPIRQGELPSEPQREDLVLSLMDGLFEAVEAR